MEAWENEAWTEAEERAARAAVRRGVALRAMRRAAPWLTGLAVVAIAAWRLAWPEAVRWWTAPPRPVWTPAVTGVLWTPPAWLAWAGIGAGIGLVTGLLRGWGAGVLRAVLLGLTGYAAWVAWHAIGGLFGGLLGGLPMLPF